MRGHVTIAVDAMGGDHGPSIVVEAVLASIQRHADLKVLLVGERKALLSLLPPDYPSERIVLVDAPDYVRMDDKPSFALRHRAQSSMAIALQIVKEARAQVCVSAGNTGALMALGRSILKTPSGIDRPAIVRRIPSTRGRCYVLDLGANVDCTAEHLFQFAILGSLMVEVVEQKQHPRVALVNVGKEDIKGSEQVRLASHMLAASPALNYVGYIEGDGIFNDVADVVVCDGFVGNVALKTAEGVIAMLSGLIGDSFRRNFYTRVLGFLARPVLRRFQNLLDPSTHNGAIFVGLNGIVVKSHGAATAKGFARAIDQGVRAARLRLPERINARLDDLYL